MADVPTQYLGRFDAAADADKFPLVKSWIATEPLPFFKELREQRPILVTPACTLVARFEDVCEVLSLPKIFTVALYLPKMGNGIYWMAHDDDALHTREKSLMQGLLNRDDLPRVRAMVAGIAKNILDQANRQIEVVDGFCRLLPATLVRDYFGLTGIDRKSLIEWSYWNQYDTFHNQPFDMMDAAKRQAIEDHHDQTGKALSKYIVELIIRRSLVVDLEKANVLRTLWLKLRLLLRRLMGEPQEIPGDDIVTRLLRTSFPQAVDFDIKRLGINAGGLLIGAIETTSQAVAQVLQYLLQNRELLARAQDMAGRGDVQAFDGMVWEALRFVPIAPYLFRQTAADYTVGEGTDYATTLRAGSFVLPVTQSAMFDPRAFDRPDEFLPDRNWSRTFHFGFGSHECLGRYVGMVMIPEMVRQVLLRPGLKAQGAIDYKEGPFPEAYRLTWD
jgi:cytochrome P450